MAEENKKLSTKVREAAAKIYERSVPEARASLKEMIEGDYDKRRLPEKIYDFAGERIVAPTVDMVGAGLEKVGMKKGGKVSSASKRADGCCQRGKTKGKIV
jgi:hypothetical protein